MKTRFAISTTFLVCWALAGRISAQETADSAQPIYDCGTLSLQTLLHIEGRPTSLRRLESILPTPSPRGYSMRELQDAGRARGLNLVGALLSKDTRSINRPMIMYLKQGAHGHFIVVRPVGSSGSLVQILDPNLRPDVIDKADLFAAREWSGLVLMPSRPNWPLRIGWALGACSLAVGFLGWLAKHGPRWRSQGFERIPDAESSGGRDA